MVEKNSKPRAGRTVGPPQISPALYAIPKTIPLPDSPSSFPPSPYIINHKARGPRIIKSMSEDDVSSRQNTLYQEKKTNWGVDSKTAILRKSTSATLPVPEPDDEHANDVRGSRKEKHVASDLAGHDNCLHDLDPGSGMPELASISKGRLEAEKDLLSVAVSADRDGEGEDFYDPGESVSFASSPKLQEDVAMLSSQKLATSGGEFYDAPEELSSESGMQTSVRNVEAELSEIRLSLLIEIEKRKQSEEAMCHMRSYWQRVREQLAQVGVFLPADPTAAMDCQQPDVNVAEELLHQFDVVRFVSDLTGREIAKAELEAELEVKLEEKNFEIVRLSDRLHYYEAVNREMSQRNQEAVEAGRRDRQRRKIRQRWMWGSIGAMLILGSAALAWSYLPPVKSSSSSQISPFTEADEVSQ